MAIKVQGTTVIDDARHISNIGVATVGILSANQITTDGSTNQSGVGVTNYVLTSGGTSGDISWQPVTAVGSGTLDGINILEEGSQVGSAGSVININFVGNNVTATGVALGLTATVTISDDPTYNSLNVTGDVAIASTVGIGTRIDLIPYDTIDNGTLSFEGSAGQLFSITNDLTSGSIFSVNDVSGIPSIDVDADGTVLIAPYGSTEYVGIGTTNPTQKLDVVGTVKATSFTGDGSGLTNVTASTGTATTITLADESTDTECFLIFATDATGDQEPKTGSNLTFNSNTGALTATSFVKESNSGGFLKADGTEDTSTYLTSYTESQTLDDVVGLGSTTAKSIGVGTITATEFVVDGGSSTGFLKADGSIDSTPYSTGTGNLDAIVIKNNGQNVGSGSTFTSLDFYNGIGVSTTPTVGLASIRLEDNISISGIFTATSFESTVSTGTAPFVVASTTKVTNLNADLLDGKSTANGASGNTVVIRNADGGFDASDVNFANVNASGIITATGFATTNGTSSQFLKADGSVDSSTYLTFYTETQTLNDVLGLGNTSSTGLSVGIVTATSFVKSSNSGGFLKADGVEDTNTYLTSYTETQALDDVVGLGSDTTQTITVGTATTGIILRPDGTLNVSGVSTFQGNVYLGDNDNLYFGDGSDLRIYHESSTGDSVIRESGTGNLRIGGANVEITSPAGSETYASFNVNGAVELYYDNDKKFETVGTGVSVFGTLETQQLNVSGVSTFTSTVEITPSSTVKALIIDGTNAAPLDTYPLVTLKGSGPNGIDFRDASDADGLKLVYRTTPNQLLVENSENTTSHLKIDRDDGRVELNYGGNKKFETTDYGIYVTGAGNTSTIGGAANLVLDPTTVGDNTGTVTILGNLQVEGTQTIINSTTLEVDDKLVSIAKSATNASQADGAGLEINGASATLTYASTGDKWVFNKAPYYNTNRILTTADEGTGNGLDADTVDGIEASSFLRSDADDVTTGQIQITKANNTATGGGQIYLNGTIGNRIDFNQNGVAAPSFTTRSAGTKIVLYPNVSSSDVDYALGIESSTLWYSIPDTLSSKQHRWYGGTTQLADLKGSGELVIGSTSLTGTASQKLQVTGGAYISGNLGVGATNPSYKLDVDGDIFFYNNAIISAVSGTDNIDHLWHNDATAYGAGGTWHFVSDNSYKATGNSAIRAGAFVNMADTGTASQKLQITGGGYISGNLGVGATNPTAKLTVDGSGTANTGTTIARFRNSSSQNRIDIIDETTTGTRPPGILSPSASYGLGLYAAGGPIRFYPASTSTEKVRIDNSGNLLINTTSATGTSSQPLQVSGGGYFSGDVGIGTDTPAYKLEVNGSFAATTKSFVIDHPTKEGMKLRYGSLEGPENGIYVRGRLKGNNTIELPEYWTNLVDEDSITVNLTPIGRKAPLHSVVDIADNTVVVESANDVVDCFYTVFGERKDVEKLEVEF